MPIDFEVLFRALPGLYLVLRPDLTIAAVSDAYLNATMTRRKDILGQGIFDVFPDNPDDPDASGVRNLRASLERVLAHRRPDSMAVQKYDVRRPTAAGGGFEERYWSPINSPVLDGNGDILWIVHRVEDVTEFITLKNLDHEREREADDLRQRAEKMEAEIFHRARALQEVNRALAESKTQLLQINESLEQRVAERTRQLEAEIGERERTQEVLRETQKLEAIGRLAGGIAHDFNNLLTVIEGNSELLLVRARDAEDVRGLQSIERAAERGAQLTRQLLAFSRHQTLRPEVVDLKKRSANMTDMLARALRGDIRVITTFADDLWPVECDVGELELALLNVCVNARDAMPDGGLVRIDARNITVRDAPLGKDGLVGEFVALSIADTGSGISPDVLTHVFEPFFTTKDIGRGTGLGLSQVYGFAEVAQQSRARSAGARR
jgi:signal transduction histidine kinase